MGWSCGSVLVVLTLIMFHNRPRADKRNKIHSSFLNLSTKTSKDDLQNKAEKKKKKLPETNKISCCCQN